MFQPAGVTLDDLGERGRKVARLGGRQLLLIAADDRLFALANRCPHEGYPLSEGTLGPGCVLTCDWHNWKFELDSGRALVGRDPARVYPVEVRGREVFVDLADPPAERIRDRALDGLAAAMADDDQARIAREVARLERAGFDARLALGHAMTSTSGRLEGGMTHAHAAAADWLALSARAGSADERLAALLEPIGHLAWDVLGAGEFPYPEGVRRWDGPAFLGAMEAEDEAVALALVRGAFADGLSYAELRPWLASAALAHYADFGHSAIYVLKAGQLIERLGEPVAETVAPALVRQLVFARREDRLPEFRGYAKALAEWSPVRSRPLAADDLVGLSVNGVLRRLSASAGRPPSELYEALLGAAGWNMLHFDAIYDQAAGRTIADNVGWLDFTHALTFGSAARRLCEESPALWPSALLQLGLFVGRNRGYVAEQDVGRWRIDEVRPFVAAEMARLFDHGIPEPIIACHRLKVLFALDDELAASPDGAWAGVTCAAVNRYLNTPMKRRHGLRVARQARAFVAREG